MVKRCVVRNGEIGCGNYILYVIRSAYYVEYNYSLAAAIKFSNKLNIPLRVVAWLDIGFNYSNQRNVSFLIDGIEQLYIELESKLEICYQDDRLDNIVGAAQVVISDTIHSSFQSDNLSYLVSKYNKYYEEYENSVVVPCSKAYPKLAYGAYVIRKSLLTLMDEYMIEIKVENLKNNYPYEIVDFKVLRNQILPKLKEIDITMLRGGCTDAKKVMRNFVENNLSNYNRQKKVDLLRSTSRISAYLSNGHISPIMVLKMASFESESLGYDSFVEQVLVRRELAFNYSFYATREYSFEHLPNWAKITIEEHRGDERLEIFTTEEIIQGRTSNLAFNACQKQLLKEGYMHNYMRMYWAKTIISFTPTVDTAFELMLYINETYQLDGRGPTAIVGILWNFGLHDRAWFDREVFGKLRYMNYNGLVKKTNILDYIDYYSKK